MTKHKHSNHGFRIGVSSLILFFVGLSSVQALTLTIPHRGAGSMQTASTTIEFDAASIDPVASITISSSTGSATVSVPTSPCTGFACSQFGSITGSGANSDEIEIVRITGTNRAQLRLTFSASFADGDYCAYNAPSSARTYGISLTGFGSLTGINGYRITSFMAPSNANCQFAYARVPGPKPSITPDPSVNKLGRLPLNLVFVLDKSGSMDDPIPEPGATDIRWDRLKSSVQFVTAVWEVIGYTAPLPPNATHRSEGHVEDRLGLVFFGSTASDALLDGASFFKQRGTSTSPWTSAINTALSAISPNGSTSIGAGIVNAKSRLGPVNSIQGDSSIILFTDGEQNREPCIIREGETTTSTSTPFPGFPFLSGFLFGNECSVSSPQPASAFLQLNGSRLARDVLPRGPIYAVGFGELALTEASAQLLDEISQETAGAAWFPNTGIAMDYSILNSLIDTLKGSTVTQLGEKISTIPVGGVSSSPLNVYIDPSVPRATFALSWDGGVEQEVALEIRRPDGTVVTAPLVKSGNSYRVAGLDLPANGTAGNWTATVRRYGNQQKEVKFNLTAYAVESLLSTRVSESANLSTGETIKVVAEVGWGDDGLANLPAGAIKATIEKPGADIGTILHKTDIKWGRSDDDRKVDFTNISPAMYKVRQLMTSSNLLDRIKSKPSKTIELVNQGYGRYEGSFDGTNVGGTYRIRVDFNWTDERTGKIVRTQLAERKVVVLPDSNNTLVDMILIDRGVILSVTPIDRFDNYVGPGFASNFSIQIAGKAVDILATNPGVNGSYEFNLDKALVDIDPEVKISFAGELLRDSRLSLIEEPGTEPGGGNGRKSFCNLIN